MSVNERRDRLASIPQSHPWQGIPSRAGAADVCNAFVEIVPADTVKFELDKHSGHLRLDRPQRYSSQCPALYGFIPRTYCGRLVAERCAERSGLGGIEGNGDPFIGIANSHVDIIPGHVHLHQYGRIAKEEIRKAGGVPFEFNTIGVDDGIAMGHDSMLCSLPSRELIADSIETMMNAHKLDALLCIPDCDKIVPGMLMGALRVDAPTVFVSGGPMLKGHRKDGTPIDLSTAFEAVGKRARGQAGARASAKGDRLEVAAAVRGARHERGGWGHAEGLSPIVRAPMDRVDGAAPGSVSRGRRQAAP